MCGTDIVKTNYGFAQIDLNKLYFVLTKHFNDSLSEAFFIFANAIVGAKIRGVI